MVYYKTVLDNRKAKTDGIYPIVIRITSNRKSTTFSTGIRVALEFWDFKTLKVKGDHPNSAILNKNILAFDLKIQKIVLQLEEEEAFSFEELKTRLVQGDKQSVQIKITSFDEYARAVIKSLFLTNKTGNAIIYQTATNQLLAYVKNPKLKFTEITFSLLDGFKNHLIKSGLKPNSISNYFRTIRAIYNRAIKDKIVDRSHYPFLDISIKTERTAKRAISSKELIKIYNLELKAQSPQWHARNCFLLSFSLIGISFTDLGYLKPENIRKGRLIYKRRKTGKELNIKLLPFTLHLLDNYKDSNSKYLLPILPSSVKEDSLQAKNLLMQWIKTTNKWLNRIADDCGVEDEVTTYVARHTWATCAKRLGYSNELIAESLGHEYGNKITNIYLDNFEQSVIDDVNEKVVALLK